MEVISVLGKGSQGLVELVKYDGKEYAWKHSERISMMEVDVMFRVKSPYIVSAVNITSAPEGIIMTYLPFSLDTYLGHKRFDLMKQALIGLHHLHLADIIHFDIKPDNIGVDKDGVVKLIDFGYATKIAGPGEEVKTYGKGTPFYASPKMAERLLTFQFEITGSYKDDVFSMGIVLYLMLYGYNDLGKIDAEYLQEKIDKKGVLEALQSFHKKILAQQADVDASNEEKLFLEAIKKMISYDGTTVKDILNFLSIDGEENRLQLVSPDIPSIPESIEMEVSNLIVNKTVNVRYREEELIMSLFKRGYQYSMLPEINMHIIKLLNMCLYICKEYYGSEWKVIANIDRKELIRFLRYLRCIIFTPYN